MKFLIISHVNHVQQDGLYYGYEPYVSEMNIWLKYVDNVEVIAPLQEREITKIDKAYKHDSVSFKEIPRIEFKSLNKVIASIIRLPKILWTLYKGCASADHIHLRCPGNIGLLGCFVQILFPKKIKTAKYAGNWDPNSRQPFSYRFQKQILKNTFLSKNMKVLVYGDWKDQTTNIKSFFTASFSRTENSPLVERDYSEELKFIFVGSLVEGKRPLLSIKIIELLIKRGMRVFLDIYGDGILMNDLQNYVVDNKLDKNIKFHGNQNKNTLIDVYKQAHFLILGSKSEGWPKAVAEAMFFFTIPIATSISCIPQMLEHGKRGILIEPKVNSAVNTILESIDNSKLKQMAKEAAQWSRQFNLERFGEEISTLVKS